MSDAEVTISLNQDHVLVLFKALRRVSDQEEGWVDQAEQRAVYDLTASLEALRPAFADDYSDLLRSTRYRTRDAAN